MRALGFQRWGSVVRHPPSAAPQCQGSAFRSLPGELPERRAEQWEAVLAPSGLRNPGAGPAAPAHRHS